jgi:multimeric flavodoxin WrbA
MLVAIEESRLVFRREARWTDGKRETTVEMKPLALPNAVKDGMTTTASTGPTATHTSPSLPALGASLNDDAMKKMVEDFTKLLLPMFGSPANVDPNSPEMKTLMERLKGAAKPK